MSLRLPIFPLDCIGVIISYLKSTKTLSKLLVLNTYVKKYIEEVHPMCCSNFRFELRKSPLRKLPYVINLECHENQGTTFSSCGVFPNLKSLTLTGYKAFQRPSFYSQLPKNFESSILILQGCQLEKLSVNWCRSFSLPRRMKFYESCETLRVLSFRFTASIKIDTSDFLNLKNLEELEMVSVNIINCDNFRNLKKLKKLKLTNPRGIESRIFSFFGESLKILKLKDIFLDHYLAMPDLEIFKYLLNIEFLKIVNCNGFSNKEEIKKRFVREPETFILKPLGRRTFSYH